MKHLYEYINEIMDIAEVNHVEPQNTVQSLGWSDFIMGDGGRKVNYYNRSTGDMAQGRDPSQNLILVYKRKEPHPSPTTAGRMGSG